jgi:hypothetical protein
MLAVIMILELVCQAEDLPMYPGHNERDIKALSQAEVSAYLDGRGMGSRESRRTQRLSRPSACLAAPSLERKC